MMKIDVWPIDVRTTLMLVIMAEIRFCLYRNIQCGVKINGMIAHKINTTDAINTNCPIAGLISVIKVKMIARGMLSKSKMINKKMGIRMIWEKSFK
jgi:hypothetical protein